MEVTIEFVGKDEVPYRFTSRIKGEVKEKLQLCLEVPPCEKKKHIQRRQFVRTDAVLDVQIQPTNKEEFRTLSYNITEAALP